MYRYPYPVLQKPVYGGLGKYTCFGKGSTSYPVFGRGGEFNQYFLDQFGELSEVEKMGSRMSAQTFPVGWRLGNFMEAYPLLFFRPPKW